MKKRNLEKTIEILNGTIYAKDEIIKAQEEEIDDLRKIIDHLQDRLISRSRQNIFTKIEGGTK